jgi:hypothetical protein
MSIKNKQERLLVSEVRCIVKNGQKCAVLIYYVIFFIASVK